MLAKPLMPMVPWKKNINHSVAPKKYHRSGLPCRNDKTKKGFLIIELFQNESPFNSTRIKVVEEVLLLQYRVKMQQSSFFLTRNYTDLGDLGGG